MLEQIKEIVAESLNVEADTLTTDTSFKEDLGADSLDLFELVMAFEEAFEIEIPSEDGNYRPILCYLCRSITNRA